MKYKYEILIYYSDKDKCFIAEVPELPGCMADGKSYREALDNVQIIIDQWIDTANSIGRTIPKPRGRLIFA